MNLREKLAALEHEQWAAWMKHLFSLGYDPSTGCIKIGRAEAERWARQVRTPYERLSEDEKESDREWADKVMRIIIRDQVDEAIQHDREMGII